MKVLCTFPGKHGDLLWALPTVRAIAEHYAVPVDLLVSQKYSRLLDLIELQPYIGAVHAGHRWAVQETAPMTPRIPPEIPAGYDEVYHLGYENWPEPNLPINIYSRATVQLLTGSQQVLPLLDLTRPWITARPFEHPSSVIVGFTDEWFELKVGLTLLLHSLRPVTGDFIALCAEGSRWATEVSWPPVGLVWETDWMAAARFLAGAQVFFGCCSALHVLACAIGVPAVIMEPNEHRWNPVFWPYGQYGPQTLLVRGNDGRPTFDARHCRDALQERLSCAS